MWARRVSMAQGGRAEPRVRISASGARLSTNTPSSATAASHAPASGAARIALMWTQTFWSLVRWALVSGISVWNRPGGRPYEGLLFLMAEASSENAETEGPKNRSPIGFAPVLEDPPVAPPDES